jgi:hypothetical protein
MDKYNLSDIFSDLNSESSVIMPKSIKIKNIKDVDTTSSFMLQKGAYSDATSSFMPQKGGYLNANKNTVDDVNQLLSMLSATSDDNYTTNSTDTEQLKKKLLNIVQDGGGIKDIKYSISKLFGIAPPPAPPPAPLKKSELKQLASELLELKLLEPELLELVEPQDSVEEGVISNIVNYFNNVPRKVILTREERETYNRLIRNLYKEYINVYNEIEQLNRANMFDEKKLDTLKELKVKNEANPREKVKIYENEKKFYENEKKQLFKYANKQEKETEYKQYYDDIFKDLSAVIDIYNKVADHLQYKEYLKQEKQKKGTI